ncbi:hypothetical protein KM043_009586 [Ampulex compressa]|nr:hypothetical protein KM043_009586 [Ampulex compressa]
MGCTLDGAAPDNKAVGGGRRREGWRRRCEGGTTEGRRKGSGMETENCGSLNVDLWTLNFPEGEGPQDTIGFGLRILRISETELNTRGGRRGTEEITSELVKRP